ncbi:P-loop containing nucleoside triphosphate hydrolase protein [Dendrothele bispora CBS 962.96]|uniref:P-loop containing nucleoside triphosphate hydrolase protein n=1 Tax=Dendrothele bispora (strain CBS 962.96) TaxID=1314807 RepID=A0A4S8L0K3_DENBC|nr:P-loop containing nucleoside triphosphate hydrolase protein [Dendrothele bispora CBS 962.96]
MANATPILVLSDFSKPLLHFLRSTIGGKSFNEEPEIDIADFFPQLKSMRKKLEQIRLAIESNLTEEKSELAKEMGKCDSEFHNSTSESEIVQYLSTLSEHVKVLVECLSEHFKLISDRLELAMSHGHIEFDLYGCIMSPNTLCNEHPIKSSIFLTKKIRHFGGKYFKVVGEGLEWDGNAYSKYNIERQCEMFEGTTEISQLPFNRVSQKLKEDLITRGKLYTTFAGVHYQVCECMSRVIVDHQAYGSRKGYIRDPLKQEIPTLDESLLHLLPPQVYGFHLAHKSWENFLVDKLEPVTFDKCAWDHLVLDYDTKRLIKGLVTATSNANSSSKMIGDVIAGKSGGMIAVLHGPPGTGKTLTAEAVAELLERPLYMIGFSELDKIPQFTLIKDEECVPQGLEGKLRSILSLATAWDAVVLIDEADVFLEQRSLHELKRNAMVSAVLRVLEYHCGVLFLTTNRIKTFDEAFLSRFSIAIAYPELDQAGRYVIWEKFFALADCKICDSAAEETENNVLRVEVKELAQKPFSGRTIKNLIRTAQALALSDSSPLKIGHVKTVVRAQEKFLSDFAQLRR